MALGTDECDWASMDGSRVGANNKGFGRHWFKEQGTKRFRVAFRRAI
jgi:hypothetical protein